MVTRGRCLDDELVLERALDEAFAPLRERTAPISAARARASARWYHEPASRRPVFAFVPRIAQSAVTAAVVALVFVAPAPQPTPHLEPPSVVQEYLRSRPPVDEEDLVRWLARQERTAPRPAPIDDMLRADAPPR